MQLMHRPTQNQKPSTHSRLWAVCSSRIIFSERGDGDWHFHSFTLSGNQLRKISRQSGSFCTHGSHEWLKKEEEENHRKAIWLSYFAKLVSNDVELGMCRVGTSGWLLNTSRALPSQRESSRYLSRSKNLWLASWLQQQPATTMKYFMYLEISSFFLCSTTTDQLSCMRQWLGRVGQFFAQWVVVCTPGEILSIETVHLFSSLSSTDLAITVIAVRSWENL